jgi:hypothetical protein
MNAFALPFLVADAMLEVWLAALSAWELSRGEPVVLLMGDEQ